MKHQRIRFTRPRRVLLASKLERAGIPAQKALAEPRKKYGPTSGAHALQNNSGEWVKRLHALVDSQSIRPNAMDDSREDIYAGREKSGTGPIFTDRDL